MQTQQAAIKIFLENLPVYHPVSGNIMDEYSAADFIDDITSAAFTAHGINCQVDNEEILEHPVFEEHEVKDKQQVPTIEDVINYYKNQIAASEKRCKELKQLIQGTYVESVPDEENEDIDEEPINEENNLVYTDLNRAVEKCLQMYFNKLENDRSITPCYPVGFVKPDGGFLVIPNWGHGLAHIEIADAYCKKLNEQGGELKYRSGNNFGYDNELEVNGWVKVHGWDIRYYSDRVRYNN